MFNKTIAILSKGFLVSGDSAIAQHLMPMYFLADQPQHSIPILELMIKRNPSNPNFERLKLVTQTLVNLKNSYNANSTNVEVINQIAMIYLKLQYLDNAQYYAEKAHKLEPKNKTAIEILNTLQPLLSAVRGKVNG